MIHAFTFFWEVKSIFLLNMFFSSRLDNYIRKEIRDAIPILKRPPQLLQIPYINDGTQMISNVWISCHSLSKQKETRLINQSEKAAPGLNRNEPEWTVMKRNEQDCNISNFNKTAQKNTTTTKWLLRRLASAVLNKTKVHFAPWARLNRFRFKNTQKIQGKNC